MNKHIVFAGTADVYKYDGGYRPLSNGHCRIQLISTEPHVGVRPVQLLQAFTLNTTKLILEVDFSYDIHLRQSKDLAENMLSIKTSSGIEYYMFVTVGDMDEIMKFSQYLLKFTNINGMMNSQQQDWLQSTHQVRKSLPNPNSAFAPTDQLRLSDSRLSNRIQYLEQQGGFQRPTVRLDNEGHAPFQPRIILDDVRKSPQELTFKNTSLLPNEVGSADFGSSMDSRFPQNYPLQLESSVVTTQREEGRLVSKKSSASDLILNSVNATPLSKELVEGTQSQIRGESGESKQPSTGSLFENEVTENICRILVEAIKDGNEEKSSRLAMTLAKRKSKLSIRDNVNGEENRVPEKKINITVHIEFKNCKSPVLIKLDVDPNTTNVSTLKKMVHQRYRFPSEVQRWIIGKRLPKDSDTLRSLGVNTTGTVIFLYLLSAMDAAREEHKPVGNNRLIDKAPSLPSRDYQNDGFVGVPPLDARSHKYATVPVNPEKEFDSQNYSDRIVAPQLENSFNRIGDVGQLPDSQLASNPPAIPTHLDNIQIDRTQFRPRPTFKDQGWKCPACTFLNVPTRPGCMMCCTPRPAEYIMPPNFVIDEGEMQRLENELLQDQLAHNYEEEEKEMKRRVAAQNFQQTLEIAQLALIPNHEPFECPICFDQIEINDGVMLRECLHKICRPCLKDLIKASEDPEILCPTLHDGIECMGTITAQEIQAILSAEEYTKYLQLSVNAAENKAANSFHCKTVNCHGWCIYEDEVNWFVCAVCRKRNCLTCKAIHDGMTCQEYQDDLKRRANSEVAAKRTQEMLEELIRKGDAMKCPQCSVILQKKDGCDWMRCSMCRTEICWATKGRRWGPQGRGDTSGGCMCSPAKRCHPNCGNCH